MRSSGDNVPALQLEVPGLGFVPMASESEYRLLGVVKTKLFIYREARR